MANKRGTTVQSTKPLSAIRSLVSEFNPKVNTVADDEDKGIATGITPKGRLVDRLAKRSLMSCRLRYTSVFSLKVAVMIDRPCMDSERTDSIPTKPLIPVSIWRVTKPSTCSADKPGASV